MSGTRKKDGTSFCLRQEYASVHKWNWNGHVRSRRYIRKFLSNTYHSPRTTIYNFEARGLGPGLSCIKNLENNGAEKLSQKPFSLRLAEKENSLARTTCSGFEFIDLAWISRYPAWWLSSSPDLWANKWDRCIGNLAMMPPLFARNSTPSVQIRFKLELEYLSLHSQLRTCSAMSSHSIAVRRDHAAGPAETDRFMQG